MRMRSFSGRQLALLEMLDQIGIDGHISYDDAQALNQSTFRSALIRGYCVYRSGGGADKRGFHITKEGKNELHAFHNADIVRKNPTLPLTSYFDAAAYGFAAPAKQKKAAAAKAPRGPAPKGVRDNVRDNVREFLRKGA